VEIHCIDLVAPIAHIYRYSHLNMNTDPQNKQIAMKKQKTKYIDILIVYMNICLCIEQGSRTGSGKGSARHTIHTHFICLFTVFVFVFKFVADNFDIALELALELAIEIVVAVPFPFCAALINCFHDMLTMLIIMFCIVLYVVISVILLCYWFVSVTSFVGVCFVICKL
jgi:hypothetical protein